jgi:hypothetical protein
MVRLFMMRRIVCGWLFLIVWMELSIRLWFDEWFIDLIWWMICWFNVFDVYDVVMSYLINNIKISWLLYIYCKMFDIDIYIHID